MALPRYQLAYHQEPIKNLDLYQVMQPADLEGTYKRGKCIRQDGRVIAVVCPVEVSVHCPMTTGY